MLDLYLCACVFLIICECVFVIMCLCVWWGVCVCLCVSWRVCVFVCVFLWLAPASLPPFPIRPHGSLPLVCLQRLHLSKKEKRANIDQIMCRCCVCVLWLVACMRVCEFLYISANVCAADTAVLLSYRGLRYILCVRQPPSISQWKLGSEEKNTVFDHVTWLVNCCTRLSVWMSWD